MVPFFLAEISKNGTKLIFSLTPPPTLIPARNARNLFRVRAYHCQRVGRCAACRLHRDPPLAAAPLRVAAHVISTHPLLVDCSAAIAIVVSNYNHTNTSVVCDLFSSASSVLCCACTAARAPVPEADDDARAAAFLLAQRAPLLSVVSVEGFTCAMSPSTSNSCTFDNINSCTSAAGLRATPFSHLLDEDPRARRRRPSTPAQVVATHVQQRPYRQPLGCTLTSRRFSRATALLTTRAGAAAAGRTASPCSARGRTSRAVTYAS